MGDLEVVLEVDLEVDPEVDLEVDLEVGLEVDQDQDPEVDLEVDQDLEVDLDQDLEVDLVQEVVQDQDLDLVQHKEVDPQPHAPKKLLWTHVMLTAKMSNPHQTNLILIAIHSTTRKYVTQLGKLMPDKLQEQPLPSSVQITTLQWI